MGAPMTDFDAELKRAFAGLEDPADQGFTAAVSARVAGREKRQSVLGVLRVGAFVIAGGAFLFAMASLVQLIGPMMVAQLGLEFTSAYATVSKGAADAASLQGALASMLTPLLLAAAAGIGGLSIARSATE
jgi:hypothetical protein